MKVLIEYTVQSRRKGSHGNFEKVPSNATFRHQRDAESRAKALSKDLEYRIIECTETRRIVATGPGKRKKPPQVIRRAAEWDRMAKLSG